MFEALELGRRVKHKKFESAETELRHRLLQAQFELGLEQMALKGARSG